MLYLLFLALPAAPAGAQNYAFKFGSILFNAHANTSIEWNDNINSSGIAPLDDVFLTLGMRFDALMSFYKENQLTFGFGLEYRDYFQNDAYDTFNQGNFFNLAPEETRIAANLLIGNIIVRLYDRIGYDLDPTESRVVDPATGEVVSAPLAFSRFDNALGADIDWNLNTVQLFARLSRNDLITTREEFSFLDRTRYNVTAGVSVPLPPRAAVYGSISRWWLTYDEAIQNDGGGYSFGIGANWQATDLLRLSGDLYWSVNDFDADGLIGDLSNPKGITGALRAEHRFNSFAEHSITYQRSINLGFVSNTITTTNLRYEIGLEVGSRSDATINLTWQDGRDSGGFEPESYDSFFIEAGIKSDISSRAFWTLRYRSANKGSNLRDRDYDQNSLRIGFEYQF